MAGNVKLADKLRRAMKEAGHTHRELAAHFGVGASAVYDWLKTGRISKDRIPELAKLYGYPVAWWLDAMEDDEAMLTRQEKQLVDAFRALPAEHQARLSDYASLLASSQAKDAKDESDSGN